ncbi:hypothetical protein ACJJIK_02165 [Microbulbifer sp. ZKSA006]|uniref:hypothetical protein n=1 Tax=Microbulbifer sp. ZKSA006 TaxID=3243390 RepID=UPI0040393EFB
MNIEARIENVKIGTYETFLTLSGCSIQDVSQLSVSNPEERPFIVGDLISLPVSICFVNEISQQSEFASHYIRQLPSKNGTEICGVVESIDSEGDIVCAISEVGSIHVELEISLEVVVGAVVSFSGELRAKI